MSNNDEQKLQDFIEAVGRLFPKDIVTDPMNIKHSAMELAYYEGRDFNDDDTAPIFKRKRKCHKAIALHGRINSHFKNHDTLHAYALISDTTQMKFRTRSNRTLERDIYYKCLGRFSSPQAARETLNLHL